MDSNYREIIPSPKLSSCVERFWTKRVDRPTRSTILPDGCADFIFCWQGRQLLSANFVGVMTRPHAVTLDKNLTILGVRFLPGMAGTLLPGGLPQWNDQTVPLRTLLGSHADALTRGWSIRPAIEAAIEVLESRLIATPVQSATRLAIGQLLGRQGDFTLEELARVSEISPRQLRRVCQRQTGLSPKQLQRTLRFRRAATMLRELSIEVSVVAQRCGYCDQSHLVREFRQLAGMSPSEFRQKKCG